MSLRWDRAATPDFDDVEAIADLKSYLRIEGDYADREVSMFLGRAIDYLEHRTRRQVLTATLTYSLDCFPANEKAIQLPRAPLQSITTVAYVDEADAPQTWDAANYNAITNTEPGYLRKAYANGAYSTWPDGARDVVITYVAGYGANWSDLPGMVQDCLSHLVAHYYYNRGSEPELGGIEHCIQGLIVGDEFTW